MGLFLEVSLSCFSSVAKHMEKDSFALGIYFVNFRVTQKMW